MNVYDFDNTIYDGDSTVDFCKYCMKRYPLVIAHVLPVGLSGISLAIGLSKKDRFKSVLYKFLKRIPDVDDAVEDFWNGHRKNVQKWYLDQKQETDVIISASPEFLLKPVADELGVILIASPVDKKTGKLLGPNNSNEEKVRRFTEIYGDGLDAGARMADRIDEFYSDSDNDLPMARLARRAYKVKHGKISPWNV
jgi:phosphoserine phosphatase